MAAGRKVLPWTNTNPQAEQERFINAYLNAYLEGRGDFSALCPAFGISRKTGYKRVKR
jgi:transcriptional regulator of acetoin/glycerol metabolism